MKYLVAFIAGALAMLVYVHRLFGGRGLPAVEVDELCEAWGEM